MEDFEQEFIDMLLKQEKFEPEAYLDKAANPPIMTIGYGTTRYANGKSVKEGDKITEEEARKLVPLYLKERESEYKQHFPNWDRFPEHMKNALRNIAYRGGASNFVKHSPKFTAAINEGMEDGFLNTEEAKAIIKEMGLDKENSVNLTDRKQRNAALLLGLYNYNHNKSIGSLGGKKNTKTRTEYTNFGNNVFYPGNNWNKKWEAIQNAYKSNADFALRLKDPNRQSIDLEDGKTGTFLLNHIEGDGYDIVYPQIQNIKTEFNLLKPSTWFNKGKQLKLIDPKIALKTAIENGDTLHVPQGLGKWFTTSYKQFYPFKKGGSIYQLKGGGSMTIQDEPLGEDFVPSVQQAMYNNSDVNGQIRGRWYSGSIQPNGVITMTWVRFLPITEKGFTTKRPVWTTATIQNNSYSIKNELMSAEDEKDYIKYDRERNGKRKRQDGGKINYKDIF